MIYFWQQKHQLEGIGESITLSCFRFVDLKDDVDRHRTVGLKISH